MRRRTLSSSRPGMDARCFLSGDPTMASGGMSFVRDVPVALSHEVDPAAAAAAALLAAPDLEDSGRSEAGLFEVCAEGVEPAVEPSARELRRS